MGNTIAEARLQASLLLPYLTQAVMALQPVRRPGLNTCGVDKWLRLYYDPEWLDGVSLKHAAGVVLHEALHPMFRCHQRAKQKLGENPQPWELKCWNIAADGPINESLRESGIELPKGGVLPELLGLPPHGITEEYYDLLIDQMEKAAAQEGPPGGPESHGDGQGGQQLHGGSKGPEGQQGSSGDGQGPGDGDPYDGPTPDRSKGEGGSSSDGQPKPWECPSPDECDVPGLNEYDQQMIAEATARAIEEFEKLKGRGTVPAGLRRLAGEILRPRVDPAKELLSRCKYALAATPGYGDFTYQRPARRQPPGSALLPAHIQPSPRVTVIADTSGSMEDRDLGLALGVVGQVIRALPNQGDVRVITGDTQIGSVSQVFRPEQVELVGGGGTDMGALIEEAVKERLRPDVIFVVSDGETGWPAHDVGCQVVACLTRKSSHYEVPDWIQSVVLNPEEE